MTKLNIYNGSSKVKLPSDCLKCEELDARLQVINAANAHYKDVGGKKTSIIALGIRNSHISALARHIRVRHNLRLEITK